jgi:hypothetical protein
MLKHLSLNEHVEAQAQEQQPRHLKIKATTPKASSWFTSLQEFPVSH